MVNLPAPVGPGSNVIPRAYRLTPDGLAFNSPHQATLRVNYDQDEIVLGMTETNLGVYVFDTIQGRWERHGGTVFDAPNYVEIGLAHFSDYGVFDCGTGTDTDALIDNGPGVVPVDDTVANSDGTLDLCDLDDDNDGLADVDELSSTACAPFDLSGTAHPNPAGGDITNDDDGDGDAAAPMGMDATDNGASWDTDNDGVLDGYECSSGSNPRDRLSKPAALGDDGSDSDGDGMLNGWERRGWGTDPNLVNTDGDGGGDCREAADVDGNGVVNSTGDFVAYANAMFKNAGKTMDFDLDKNGLANSTGDFVAMAQRVFGSVSCI
jgi:hypothetical protein